MEGLILKRITHILLVIALIPVMPILNSHAEATVTLLQTEIELLPVLKENSTDISHHAGQLILVAKDLPSPPKPPASASDLPNSTASPESTLDLPSSTAPSANTSELPSPSNLPASETCITGGVDPTKGVPHLGGFCDISGAMASLQFSYTSEYSGIKDKSHYWSVTANIEGLPVKSTLNRYAKASIDGIQYWLSLKYTTPDSEATSLQVTQPTNRWVLSDKNQRIDLQLLSKGAEIAKIKLASSSLQENSSDQRITRDAFKLCPENSPGTHCDQEISISGEKTVTMHLLADVKKIPLGEFKGNLIFVADGTALSNPIELIVLSSGRDIKSIGVVSIALGVFLAFWITVLAPHKVRRLERLRPAVLLRERVPPWNFRIKKVDDSTKIISKETTAQLNQIEHDLSDIKLKTEGFVPGRLPNMIDEKAEVLESYKVYLKARADRLNVIVRVIITGSEVVAADWEKYSTDAQKLALAETALKDLDSLSIKATPATVDASIETIIAELDAKIGGSSRGIATRKIFSNQLSSESLTARLEGINAGVWFIWLVITIVGGWAALILTDSGFGTNTDLFTCFGWGLGLQTIGPKLSELTSTKLATEVKFKIPG